MSYHSNREVINSGSNWKIQDMDVVWIIKHDVFPLNWFQIKHILSLIQLLFPNYTLVQTRDPAKWAHYGLEERVRKKAFGLKKRSISMSVLVNLAEIIYR